MSGGPLSDEERLNWLILSKSENVGPTTFRTLIKRFHTAGAALRALPELARKGGLRRPPRIFSRDDAERAVARLDALGGLLLCSAEPQYPSLLRATDTAPPLICVKGDITLLARTPVAIVGARNASALARRFARQMAREIGDSGHVIVSGLARGIDTAAHEAALDTGTIAVVAGGLDVIYPPENAELQRAIGERGLIIAEQLPGTEPQAQLFPRRNRIISGLSKALVVVEAALRSGSLITARFAAEQGRDVFAVPGSPLDPRCEGCNRLIRDGATLLMAARDVLEALGHDAIPAQMSFLEPEPLPLREPGDGEMRRVLELLSPSPVDPDDLMRESGLDAATLSALLLELSLAGRITRHADGTVSLA